MSFIRPYEKELTKTEKRRKAMNIAGVILLFIMPPVGIVMLLWSWASKYSDDDPYVILWKQDGQQQEENKKQITGFANPTVPPPIIQ